MNEIDRAAAINRCDREIEICLRNQLETDDPKVKLGALIGELDWTQERDRLLELKEVHSGSQP